MNNQLEDLSNGSVCTTRSATTELNRAIGVGVTEHNSLQHRIAYRQERIAKAYQHNLETVLKHALADSRNEIACQQLDPDWWHSFQSLAEQIHNPQMQHLWGKILTKELTQPRSFSLKALETLKRMNHRDAKLLLKAVSLCCTLEQDATPMIICGWRTEAAALGIVRSREGVLSLSQFGLPYSAVLSLRELGLLHAVELETGRLPTQFLTLTFNDRKLRVKPKHPRLHLRYYRFTNSGKELLLLLKNRSNNEYLHALTGSTFSVLDWHRSD